MEFTKEIAQKIDLRIKDTIVELVFKNGPVEQMHIGEPVQTATWTDNHHLLITLTSGRVRLYRDMINFEKI